LSDEQLAAIDKLENTDLSIFSRKVHRVRARREVLEQRRAWLAKDPPEVVRELTRDDLRRGIELLSEWLSAEAAVRKTRQHPWIIIVGALLIAGLGVAFSVESTNWLWSLAVVAAAALLAVDRWLARNQRGTDDHRPIHQHAFEQLPVPGPAAWRRSEVHVAIERLADLVGKRALVEERLTRLDQLASEEAALIRDEQELLAERSALQERLGLAFEIDDEWLPLLINRISEWQEASARLAGAERVLESLEKEADRIRTGLDEVLKPLGYVAIHSADHAEQLILDLQSRTSGFSSARRVLEDAHRAISESIEPELVEIQSSRAKIFERLQIAEDEEALIDEWLQRRASWIKCSDGLRSQQALLEDVRSDLQTTIDGLDSELDAWLEIDRLELERRIEKCLERADRRDELNKEDGRIRERIEAAKRGHELTDALAASDQALATLEAAREENRRAVVGSALTEWVREVAVDRSRPAVFQRANELFVRFTQGTFRLEMDDRSNPPRFLARRGDLPAQDLDELSDGERIQLMMAVRLAFLEQDERVPLPLLVDEVLGTSDDTRSEVMIDTMIEIAREGRQVFYCTAQGDEVAKWIARLESAEVPYKLVDLAQIRRLSRATRVPLVADIQRKSLPPKPDGLGYFEYGQLLGVSGIDPMSRTIDDVHIWHLFDDAKTVYKLLCQQITTWGQLRTLLEHGGAGVLGPSPDLPRQARAAANAIQAACEGYRVGRGKLVDRDALLDSGCVSERFIGELADLAQRLHGDAEALLAALAAKKVANWRCDRTEALREYFECEGYLSDVDPLTRTELRMRVLAAVSSEIGADVLDTGFVDRTIAALPFD